jgi:hypothetical protein
VNAHFSRGPCCAGGEHNNLSEELNFRFDREIPSPGGNAEDLPMRVANAYEKRNAAASTAVREQIRIEKSS